MAAAPANAVDVMQVVPAPGECASLRQHGAHDDTRRDVEVVLAGRQRR